MTTTKLSPTARRLLVVLETSPTKGNGYLAAFCGVVPRTIQKALHELVEAGKIEVQHHRASGAGEVARTITVVDYVKPEWVPKHKSKKGALA